MATIKAYTDLEQSKKLAKILLIESADMHYNNVSIKGINYVDGYRAELMDYNTVQKVLTKYLVNPMLGIIPCWSLAALLGVIPKIVNNETLFIETSAALWHIGYRNIYTARADNPVDACVAMIEKLHERKIL